MLEPTIFNSCWNCIFHLWKVHFPIFLAKQMFLMSATMPADSTLTSWRIAWPFSDPRTDGCTRCSMPAPRFPRQGWCRAEEHSRATLTRVWRLWQQTRTSEASTAWSRGQPMVPLHQKKIWPEHQPWIKCKTILMVGCHKSTKCMFKFQFNFIILLITEHFGSLRHGNIARSAQLLGAGGPLQDISQVGRQGNDKKWSNLHTLIALQSLAGGGFLYLGRCVPSVCSAEDVDLGWTNFFIDFLQTTNETLHTTIPSPYIMTPLNCHTEEEESKFNIGNMQVANYPYF